MFDAGAIAVVQQVAEYLAWAENDFTLRPVLAESWSHDAKAQVWTFNLRKGVTFSNGKPFSADDVVATFDRLTDPKNQSGALTVFHGILAQGGTQKVTDDSVAFHLERPFVDFPYLVSSGNYNAVMLPADYSGNFMKDAVGTGPFILSSYTPTQQAGFQRNPKYWQKGLPYLDQVVLQFYADPQPQILAIQGAAVDMMISTPYQGSQGLFTDSRIKVASAQSTQFRQLFFRVDRQPYTDKRVRQALAYTLNRPQLLDALFNGKGIIGNDTVFSSLYSDSPNLPREQDYAKAKQLLSDAGYPNGIDMTLYAELYLEVVPYATLIQEMAKPAGIRIKLIQEPQNTLYNDYYDYSLGIIDWAARPIPDEFLLPAFTCKGPWNNLRWCDSQFDALLSQYEASLDESSRRALAMKLATIMQDETVSIVAYWIDVLRAMGSNVSGVTADGAEFLDLTSASISGSSSA